MTYDGNAVWGDTPLCFTVTNTNFEKKDVDVLGVRLPFGQSFDLMQVIGITENVIKVSLIKGLLRYKIERGDIYVECSDINLLTYNTDVQVYLTKAGINVGVLPTQAVMGYSFRHNVPLYGIQDGYNRIFRTEDPFIYGQFQTSFFRPQIFHNGALLIGGLFNENVFANGIPIGKINYVVEKSTVSLPDPIYDQIRIISFSPGSQSKLVATYVVKD